MAVGAAIVAAIVGLATGVSPAGAATAPECVAKPSQTAEAALTAMMNQTRRSEGVAKVTRDEVLRSAGGRKSLAMANGAAFEHVPEESLPWAHGRRAGQNIAMAASAAGAYRAMLNSSGHRRILVGSAWRYTGVGAAVSCDGMLFVTVNLVAPRD